MLRRISVPTWSWLLTALLITACGSDSSGGGGTSSGGSSGSASAGSSSSAGGSAGGSAQVDCAALCEHVHTLCSENTQIDALWLDVCRSACDARVKLTPKVAEAERACVENAPACSPAVICVASPPSGAGGSGG